MRARAQRRVRCSDIQADARGARCFAVVMLAVAPAHAQVGSSRSASSFPFAAGGSGDGLARLIADKMRAGLNRPVIVENRTGAAGPDRRAGGEGRGARRQHAAHHADRPDRDLSACLSVARLRPDRGLRAVVAGRAPSISAWRSDRRLPAKSLKELVAWAKANPSAGQLRHAGRRLAAAFPRRVCSGSTAGIDLRHGAYRGSAAALTDLIGGQIPVVFTTISDLTGDA